MFNVPVAEGRLWAIIQQYIDSREYPPSESRVAERIGIGRSTLHNWKAGNVKMPRVEHLRALAELTGIDYEDVLTAAYRDAGALDEKHEIRKAR